MAEPLFERLCLIGVGLIGSSIARAAREQGDIARTVVAHNSEWRAKLSDGLQAAGIAVHPSEGNFILADFGTAERAKAADAALKARGLIVRAMGSYSLPQCLRITIGTAEECGMVLDALTGFLRGTA